MASLSARIAAALTGRLALRPGDRVVLAMTNNPEYLAILFAIWRAGLVAVPANAKLHPRELAYIVADCAARVCFATPDVAGPLAGANRPRASRRARRRGMARTDPRRPYRRRRPRTGRPRVDFLYQRHHRKAEGRDAEPSQSRGNGHRLFGGHRFPLARRLSFPSGRAVARDGTVRPVAHRQGDASGLAAERSIRADGNRRSPLALSLGDAVRAADRSSAPRSHPAFASAKIENIRTLLLGAAPVYAADLKAGFEVLGPRLWNGYGQGESPCTITAMPKALLASAIEAGDEQRMVSVGLARTGIEVAIVDGDDRPLPPGEVGEVVVRGDTVMAGYWNLPEASAAALRSGWLHTGDLGALDERGFLTLLDRAKDLIISGGSNIYPREIEDVLLEDPNVAEVAVIGRARSRMGGKRRCRPCRGPEDRRSIWAASKRFASIGSPVSSGRSTGVSSIACPRTVRARC